MEARRFRGFWLSYGNLCSSLQGPPVINPLSASWSLTALSAADFQASAGQASAPPAPSLQSLTKAPKVSWHAGFQPSRTSPAALRAALLALRLWFRGCGFREGRGASALICAGADLGFLLGWIFEVLPALCTAIVPCLKVSRGILHDLCVD